MNRSSSVSALSANAKIAFMRIAVRIIASFVVILLGVFFLLANDLLLAFNHEKIELNGYRSYGLVRLMGVELSQELQNNKKNISNIDHGKLLDKLLTLNPVVTDLALLNASGQYISGVGSSQSIIYDHIVRGALKMPSTADDYDHNVIFQDISPQNTPASYRMQLGVLGVKVDQASDYYLVVGFKPLILQSAEPYVYALCLSVVLVLILCVWQAFSYILVRWYLEPIAHVHLLSLKIKAGIWPVAATNFRGKYANTIVCLAEDCLIRCHAQWKYLQWQLQKLKSSVPQQTASIEAIAADVGKNGTLMDTPAGAAAIAPSVAVFQWLFFIFAALCATLLLAPPVLPGLINIIILTIFIIPLVLIPRPVFISLRMALVRGSMVGVIVGGLLHEFLKQYAYNFNVSIPLFSIYLLCALLFISAIGLGISIRKKFL